MSSRIPDKKTLTSPSEPAMAFSLYNKVKLHKCTVKLIAVNSSCRDKLSDFHNKAHSCRVILLIHYDELDNV